MVHCSVVQCTTFGGQTLRLKCFCLDVCYSRWILKRGSLLSQKWNSHGRTRKCADGFRQCCRRNQSQRQTRAHREVCTRRRLCRLLVHIPHQGDVLSLAMGLVKRSSPPLGGELRFTELLAVQAWEAFELTQAGPLCQSSSQVQSAGSSRLGLNAQGWSQGTPPPQTKTAGAGQLFLSGVGAREGVGRWGSGGQLCPLPPHRPSSRSALKRRFLKGKLTSLALQFLFRKAKIMCIFLNL